MSIKKILISQPKPESGKSPYFDIAARHDAEATFRPFIVVESVSSREFRDQKVNILDHTAIVFTSRIAMEHFFKLAEELRVSLSEEMKYFCINEQVANYLQKFIVYRKRKVFYPEAGGQAELVAIMQKHSKELYFLPMAEDHKNDLIDLLTSKKLQFAKAIMYRTVSKKFTAAEKKEKYDMIIFFSPAGVASLLANHSDYKQGKVLIGGFGPATCQAIEQAGLRLDLSAPTDGAPSMAMALEQYLKEKNK